MYFVTYTCNKFKKEFINENCIHITYVCVCVCVFVFRKF